MEERIPRVIHYCWFGNSPISENARKCIESWKKYCPNYTIMEWNEKNVDISSVDYMREAYEEKAWGFVPDVARLQIVYRYGGIYLDTDVEIVRPLDPLLEHEAFMGLEDGKDVALGLGFGAEPGHPLIGSLMRDYDSRHFRNSDGTLNRIPGPGLQAPFFLEHGLEPSDKKQTICGAVIYPSEFFCPQSFKTGILTLTENTYSIHHYDGSWLTEEERQRILWRCRIYQTCGSFAPLVWLMARVKYKIEEVGLLGTVRLAISRFFRD